MKIKAIEVMYIKLGEGGEWEHECIEENHTIKLGYTNVPHDMCLRGEWKKIMEGGYFKSKVTTHKNEIQYFYEKGEDVLWITFYAKKLWWCFSKPEIIQKEDNTKIRRVKGEWKCVDINGNKLLMDSLRGDLTQKSAYPMTICKVEQSDYTIRKINGEVQPEVKEAKDALLVLKKKLEILIKTLYWKDFEILIDLIFLQAGLQRVGTLGEVQKTLDLDLISPLTKEKIGVQVKSSSNLAQFQNYKKKFEVMPEYSRFYYVVHSPKSDLNKVEGTEKIKIMFNDEISQLALNYGLAEWIIAKSE